ncbi:oxidoreductase [Bradyrhizobium sp. AZCC 1699]|uniref:oxidoreductase n=1 Tax=unclassified Bradyrhizobium TaxID=2631580 RepID=UPI003FA5D9CB
MAARARRFAAAARRAAKIGLEGIEIHGAHGHLLHQFPRPSLITVISRVRFLIVRSKIMS